MPDQNPGLALIISAPSGAGKSTLIKRLVGQFPGFEYSVSYTTRDPRPGEVHGQDYRFVDKEQFLKLIDEGFFAEWAEVHSHLYGTPLQETENLLEQGRDILFDIDVQGAKQLRSNLAQGAYVFIFPPSRKVLEKRLSQRGSDRKETINQRINRAREELIAAEWFDYWILNDDLDQACDRLRSIYLAEKSRSCFNKELLSRVLSTWPDE